MYFRTGPKHPIPDYQKGIKSNLFNNNTEGLNGSVFLMKYSEESPHLNEFVDYLDPKAVNAGVLMSEKLIKLVLSFNIPGPYTVSKCIVSNGVEEREYSLLEVLSGSKFANFESMIDFEKSQFAFQNKYTKKHLRSLEKGYVKNFPSMRKIIKEYTTKNEFDIGGALGLHPEVLVFNDKWDYFFLRGLSSPIISEDLRNAAIEHEITGWGMSSELKDYIDYSIQFAELKA